MIQNCCWWFTIKVKATARGNRQFRVDSNPIVARTRALISQVARCVWYDCKWYWLPLWWMLRSEVLMKGFWDRLKGLFGLWRRSCDVAGNHSLTSSKVVFLGDLENQQITLYSMILVVCVSYGCSLYLYSVVISIVVVVVSSLRSKVSIRTYSSRL